MKTKTRRLNYAGRQSLVLMDLPSHILVNILLRLPSDTICCIRCVSKSLLDTVDDRSFVKLHTAAADKVPLLMCFAEPYPSGTLASLQSVKHDGTSAGKYAFKVSTSSCRRECPPYTIDFVFRNLFFFRNKHEDRGVCFLINPVRGQVLRLPRTDISKDAKSHHIYSDWYGMGFDHLTNTLKIVSVARFNRSVLAAQVLVLGTSSWRSIAPPPCPLAGAVAYFWAKNASVNGDMHWFVHGDFSEQGSEGVFHIISFDFKKEVFYWTPHPMLQSREGNGCCYWRLHLLTFRASLALVDTSAFTKIDIWVLKDYDKKEWAKEYSIDIDNLDLVREFRLVTRFTCGQWEHGIYFKSFEQAPTFFLDLRCSSVNLVTCGSGQRTRILSYAWSLISLKDFVGAENSTTDEGLNSYGNLIDKEAQGFSLSERHVLQGVPTI